jgi:transcriptional regulator with XRE-family HTH domain
MNNLKMLRERMGISIRDLADKTNTQPASISKIENGTQGMAEHYSRIFADFFDVTIDFLLCRSDYEQFKPDKVIYKEKEITYSSVISNLYKFSKDELLKISGAVDYMLERKDGSKVEIKTLDENASNNLQKDKNYLEKISTKKS